MTRISICGLHDRGAAKAAPLRNGSRFFRRICACVLLSTLASTGCYSYSLIDPAQAGTGLDVRARITPVESARIEEEIGLSNRVIQGEIVSADPTSVVLSVPTVLPGPGISTQRLHQRITLPSSAIVELEQRQLSRWRTFSLVGLAAAVAGYVVITQFDSGDGSPGTDKPVPNNILLQFHR